MTCLVYCPHCGTRQEESKALFGVGPSSIRFDFTCPGCGWLVQIKAQTFEFMLAQMGGDNAGDPRVQ